MNVGQRIREAREELGMQRTVLARRLGVAPNTVWRWEAGDREPSMALLEKIARVLRTEPAELMRGPDPKVEAPPSPEPSLRYEPTEERRSQLMHRLDARTLFLQQDLGRWQEELATGVDGFPGGQQFSLSTPEMRRAWELVVLHEKLQHVADVEKLGILEDVAAALKPGSDSFADEELRRKAEEFSRRFQDVAAFRAEQDLGLLESQMKAHAARVDEQASLAVEQFLQAALAEDAAKRAEVNR
jgi:transcriptional regulator with XRE-family HTH domain